MSSSGPGEIWAILLIVSPLAAAIIALVAQRQVIGIARVNAVLMTVAAFGLLLAVAERPFAHAIGGWAAPLGIALYADALTGILIAATSVVVLSVSFYAPDYLARF